MRPGQTIIEQLAAFVDELELVRMPPAVVHEARRCVLDTLGVVVAGQRSMVAQRALEFTRRSYAPGCASIAGT